MLSTVGVASAQQPIAGPDILNGQNPQNTSAAIQILIMVTVIDQGSQWLRQNLNYDRTINP